MVRREVDGLPYPRENKMCQLCLLEAKDEFHGRCTREEKTELLRCKLTMSTVVGPIAQRARAPLSISLHGKWCTVALLDGAEVRWRADHNREKQRGWCPDDQNVRDVF